MKRRFIPIDYDKISRDRPLASITIRAAAGNPRRGWLTAGAMTIPVALGRGGIRANKREGDGGTPRGIFHPRRLWWRADRLARPRTGLSIRPITVEDAWCEDPADRHYNQPIRLAAKANGDRLTREDHLYDLIVEIDHNTRPRIAGRGSAVFIHLARPGFEPTAGCVALDGKRLRWPIEPLGPQTKIDIR